jgi:hypothetical protein
MGDEMKIENVIVNWSYFDEEILEPYEWSQDDDLQIITSIQVLYVDDQQMNDFYNNVIYFRNVNQLYHDFIVCSLHYALAIEIDQTGKLKYRSVLTYDVREKLYRSYDISKFQKLEYIIEDYCELKEYGLTRYERIKKQSLINKIEMLYQFQPKKILFLYQQVYLEPHIDEKEAYESLMERLKFGYYNVHEYLYQLLYLI